ncbi:MAG: PRC-barrel domain-containing protein [Methanobacteriota archaeon]
MRTHSFCRNESVSDTHALAPSERMHSTILLRKACGRNADNRKIFVKVMQQKIAMYREKELVGKEVVDSEGSILGKIIALIAKEGSQYIVVGEKKFLLGKSRALKSKNVVMIPCDEIATIHDMVMLSRSRAELKV